MAVKKIKESDDEQLKVMALRIEILDEIRGCYYDLEWVESMIEKVKLRNQLGQWKKLLKEVNSSTPKPTSNQ